MQAKLNDMVWMVQPQAQIERKRPTHSFGFSVAAHEAVSYRVYLLTTWCRSHGVYGAKLHRCLSRH